MRPHTFGIIRVLPDRYIVRTHARPAGTHMLTQLLGASHTHMRAHAKKLVGWAYLRCYLRH
jgi:hypothetical protein